MNRKPRRDSANALPKPRTCAEQAAIYEAAARNQAMRQGYQMIKSGQWRKTPGKRPATD